MKKAHESFKDWYKKLPVHKSSGGPAKGTISAALAVLERLKDDFQLNIKGHTAKGGAQIRGASGQAVKKILARFGETRPFAKEGGRTNRGGRGDMQGMLAALGSKLEPLDPGKRNEILTEMQGFLVGKVVEFHNRERIKTVYDPMKSTWQNIQSLLAVATASSGFLKPIMRVGRRPKRQIDDERDGQERGRAPRAEAETGFAAEWKREQQFLVGRKPLRRKKYPLLKYTSRSGRFDEYKL